MKYSPGFALLLGSWMQSTHVLPWVSWHSEVLAFAALVWFFCIELLDMKRTGDTGLAIPRVAWVPMGLGLYALIQYGFGQIWFFGDAFTIMIYCASATMAMVIGYRWGSRFHVSSQQGAAHSQLTYLAITVVVGALLSAVVMLAQSFDVWTGTDWIVRVDGFRRPGGNLGQTNHMGTLVLMGTASLLFLYQSMRVSILLAGVVQLLLIMALAMTESRTGLLSAVLLTAWCLVQRRLFVKGSLGRQLACVWFVLLFMAWAWPLFIQTWHFADGVRWMSADIGMRRVVWAQLLEALMQRPWMGWGLREVSEAHNAVLHQYDTGGPFSYAHNVLLDLAIGIGIPLTILLLGLAMRWVWIRMRATSTVGGWYCIAIAIPLVAHSMFEFPFAYAYFLLPVLLAVGILDSQTGGTPGHHLRLVYAGTGASVLVLLMAWSVLEYVAIEEDFRVARFEALAVGKTPGGYMQPEIILLTQLDAMLKATRTRPAPKMDVAEVELLRHAAMRFPWTAIQNRYALSLALNGDPEEATRQLQVIRAMHGEKHYVGIKAHWEQLAQENYPELKNIIPH